MTERFVDDDAGYLGWLAAHPAGFVLNTFVHATPGYLIVHRAACRTINRDLSVGRHWTHEYGKACADSFGEVVAWSLDAAGAEPRPCGICRPRGRVGASEGRTTMTAVALVDRSGGSSRRAGPAAVERGIRPTFEGTPIRIAIDRMDGGPQLVIDGAQWLAEMFFRFDPSAHGTLSYDAATLTTTPGRFDDADITTVNRTMASRMPHKAWADLLGHDPSPILAMLPTGCDLIDEPDDGVAHAAVTAVAEAIATMRAPGRNVATTTKVLHLKRPALVPVLDSLVLQQLGGRGRTTAQVLDHLRAVGRNNLASLRDVRKHLSGLSGHDGRPTERTLVRILDALLWSTHPSSVIYPLLSRWQTTIAVARAD